MAAKVDVKTLGYSGVMIDQNQYDPNLPDDSLRSAQNATHDPTSGFGGGLRKRPGLRQFNKAYAGGPILGGIPMQVAGTGGAPVAPTTASVDDPTGSPAGAGNSTGAPGASTGGSGASGGTGGVPSAGAGLFNGGTPIYNGARLMIVGRANNFNPGGGNGLADSNGWYMVRGDWATALAAQQQNATPGPPDGYGPTGVNYPPTALFSGLWGRSSVFDASTGYLFYPLSHYRSPQSGTPNGLLTTSIRKTNGATDVLVTTLPINESVIYAMILSDDGSSLFVGVRSTTSANVGAVYKVDKQTGNITTLNYRTDQIFPGAPFCLSTFIGKLFIGEWQQSGNELISSGNAQIDGTPVQDNTQPIAIDNGFTPSLGGAGVSCMIAFPKADLFNQCLFAGMATNGAAYSQVWVRQRAGVGVSGSGWAASLTPSDSAAVAGNAVVSFCEFNGKLYAAWRNGGTGHNANIYQFTPTFANKAADGGWNGSGTWTSVYSIGQGTAQFTWYLVTDGNYLYAIGGSEGTTNSNQAVFTPDGVNWTDKSSVIFGHGANDDTPLPIIFFVNQ